MTDNRLQDSTLTLDEFPAATPADWRAEAERALKGVPFEKKLVTQTPEGIAIQPIYFRADSAEPPTTGTLPGMPSFVRGATVTGHAESPWEIAQAIPYGSAKAFNAAARHDIECGQTAVRLSLDRAGRFGCDPDLAEAGGVGFCGTSIASVDDLSTALAGLTHLPLHLEPGSCGLPMLALLAVVLDRAGTDRNSFDGLLEQDPVGELLVDGSLPQPMDAALDQMALVTRWATDNLPNLDTVCVRAHGYNDAGGNAVQELAFALSTGVEYLRRLTERGLSVDAVASRMRFAFSIGGDFFMGIAKFRAARKLWHRIVAASGGSADAGKMRIHARTALWNKTVRDPYVNMLRNTTEACSAVLGGCDSLQVAAFDEVVRPPDEFSRRIARNTQIILSEECRLDRVIDPAGGSWFVESFTDQLAGKAWALFQETERHGGMLAALGKGFPQAEVDRVNDAKAKAVAQRRTRLVGTNVYANPTEPPLETRDWKLAELQRKRAAEIADYRTTGGHAEQTALLERLSRMLDSEPENAVDLAIDAAAHGATLGELWRTLKREEQPGPTITPLPLRRAASPFERLRDAVAASDKGNVFLANMGPLRQHKARADFSTSFFQAGGFDVRGNQGFPSPEKAARAAIDSAAPVVVICSTDETYPELVPPLVGAIKTHDPSRVVVVAGYPEAHLEGFREAGVDAFIHLRANCLETLRTIATRLGLQS